MKEVTVDQTSSGWRLDRYLADVFPDWSRTRLQSWIETGNIQRNGQVFYDVRHKVQAGETYLINPPEVQESHLVAQEIPLNILYEDEHLLVIDKPLGMVTHPAPGHSQGTLVNALLAHCGDSLSGIGDEKRPGIVHRLDKDTTGLMVVAKHDAAHQALSSQFSDRTLSRCYHAWVFGKPSLKSGSIDKPIGRHPHDRQKMSVQTRGKEAVTMYTVDQEWVLGNRSITRLTCRLKTGRTHQIRVHCQSMKWPLIGDPVYGPSSLPLSFPQTIREFPRQALHAFELSFYHPFRDEVMTFQSPWPQDLKDLNEVLDDF